MKIAAAIFTIFFVCSCAATDYQTRSREVKIIRDDYGAPHIYADTIYGLYYGYGYAVAQDRLFQMEMARRSTQGMVAEVFGAEFVAYDQNTRTLFSPASIRRQIAALEQEDRDVFAGFAAGLNAWLDEIRNTPQQLLPKQFSDLDFEPANWTDYDVAMIFIGTMNNRYGDFNTELENASILQTLVDRHGAEQGRELFDLLNPRFTDNAPTTIPVENWSRPAADSLATANFDTFVHPVANAVANTPVISGFSNCYVIGREKLSGGGAILVNGPQFGWFNPSYVYSVGMHGAGIDVAGNTPFAYPMIMFGHNQTISWGSTWGASDIVDIFSERLNADNPEQYFYKGNYVDLESRVERIRVRDAEDVVFTARRSVHGPIMQTDHDAGIAYAKKRAWDGEELETLLAWLYATWAADFDGWKAQAEKSAINVNMYFADVDGNIGYFHGGKFPQRVAGHDNRLPANGDGSMDWQGRQSPQRANPYVLNPATGFLANWNNKPGQGVMNPDFFFYSWSAADRVEYLQQELAAQEQFTPETAWELIEKSSHADLYARYFLPHIDSAVGSSGNLRLQDANNILRRWDQFSRDNDADGFYDQAATAIFRTFVNKLVERVLSDDLGDAYAYFADTGYPTAAKPTGAGTNLSPGVKAVLEALEGRTSADVFNGQSAEGIIVAALRDTLAELTERQGPDLVDFRLPVAARPFSTRNFLGVPQAGGDEAMTLPIEQNRGTENNMIVMHPGKIVAWEVVAPGQNAFISPDGRQSVHYRDQFEMYEKFGKKRVWFYASDVEANKKSETVLSY